MLSKVIRNRSLISRMSGAQSGLGLSITSSIISQPLFSAVRPLPRPLPLFKRGLSSAARNIEKDTLPDHYSKIHRIVKFKEEEKEVTWILKSQKHNDSAGLDSRRLIEIFSQNLAMEIFVLSPRTELAPERGKIRSEVLAPGESMDLHNYLYEYLPKTSKRIPLKLQEELMNITLFKLIIGDRDIKPDNFIIINYDTEMPSAYSIDGEFSLRVDKKGKIETPGDDVNYIFKKAIKKDGLAEVIVDIQNVHNTQTEYCKYDNNDKLYMEGQKWRLFQDLKKTTEPQMAKMISLLSRNDFEAVTRAMKKTNQHIANAKQYSPEEREEMIKAVEKSRSETIRHVKLFDGMMKKHQEEKKTRQSIKNFAGDLNDNKSLGGRWI